MLSQLFFYELGENCQMDFCVGADSTYPFLCLGRMPRSFRQRRQTPMSANLLLAGVQLKGRIILKKIFNRFVQYFG